MLRHMALFLALCLGWAAQGQAQSIAQCEPYRVQTVQTDFAVATRMTAAAAAAVGDTDRYAAWFGAYTDKNAETVRGVFKAIHARLVSGRMAFVCATKSDATCGEAVAWVLPVTGVVRLCPGYFRLPSLQTAHGGADVTGGSREGALLHEISHYTSGTGDECVAWSDCGLLARRSPELAIANANSFEYFAEDLALAAMEEN